MKIKYQLSIVLLCLILVCSLTACNFADLEFNGLLGSLFEDIELPGGDVIIDEWVPVDPLPAPETDIAIGVPETWGEDVTMGPGEQLYGFPESLELTGSIMVYEANEVYDIYRSSGSELVSNTSFEMFQQFTDLYGYGVVLESLDSQSIKDIARNEAMAGTGTLNLCYLGMNHLGEISTSGIYYNSNTLAVELDNGCWFDGFNEDLRVGDAQFAFAGYLTPYVLFNAQCLTYNYNLLTDFRYEVQEAVYSGSWSLDELFTLSSLFTSDLNGNGKYDDNDRYGVVFEQGTREDFVFYNSGIDLFENGTYEDRTEECAALYSYLSDFRNVTYEPESSSAELMFLRGNALFYATTLGQYAGFNGYDPMCKRMDYAVGVVPVPAYTYLGDNAANLRANVDWEKTSVLCVPYSATGDVAMTLNVLSVLAVNHMQPMIDARMNEIMIESYALDMSYFIMNSVSCNVDYVLLKGSGYECNPLKSQDLVSFLKTNGAKYEKALAKMYKAARNYSE